MNCPNCKTPLTSFPFADVQLDECAGCGGIWFDADELRRTQHSAPDAWEKLEAQIASRSADTVSRPQEKFCPRCGEELLPYRYMATSDVHLDECEKCGGTWVDDGELEAMSEFLKQSQVEALSPKQFTPDETQAIRDRLAGTPPSTTDHRANCVADAFSFISTRGRWRDPYRFEGWFGPDT